MLEIIRTTLIKIDIPFDSAQRTVMAWTDACNAVSRIAFEHDKISNAVKLQQLGYETAKSFGLSAQVAVSCIRQVASKYAAARTAKKILTRPVSFRQCGVALQGGVRGRDFSFTRQGLSVWTVDGRLKSIPYHGAPALQGYIDSWKLGDARLLVRKGAVYLSVSFKSEVESLTKPNDAVVGVDRGINMLATVTDGKRQRFFGGGHLNQVRSRYVKVRASLQRKKAQTGGRGTRRALKRLSGRGRRFQRNENHVVSRRIVEFAQQTGNPTIAIEDLGGIRNNARARRKEQRADLNCWAFCELEQFTAYKAQTLGMEVISVDPKHTSQGCPRCGHTEKANRHKHRFLCKACGYELHADLAAARNIRLRGILARQALCQDGAKSCVPEARGVDPGSNPGESAGKLPTLGGST
jgi:IS605 OrfB family transposase